MLGHLVFGGDDYGSSCNMNIIPRNVRLSEAPSHGKPVLLYDASSKGAQGYLALARELLQRHNKRGTPTAPKKKGAR